MNTGGPKLIHSTSSDGALTVVFNPKESIPGRQKSGWQATVRSQQPQPMALVSATVAQASTAEAPVGATGLEFLDLTLETKGSLQPKKLEAIKLQLKGAPQAFTKLYLYALSSPKPTAQPSSLAPSRPQAEDDRHPASYGSSDTPRAQELLLHSCRHRSGRRSRPDA